jgi:phage I-like protein
MAALVNHPALLGMDAVESAEALSAALAAALPRIRTTSHQEPAPMTTQNIALAALATALGLTAAATEAEALSTIAALKAKAEKADKPELPNDVASALGVKTSAEALSAITALKTAQTGLDGAMTQITALQGQVQALTQRQTEGDLVALADGAIAEGKFVPALREQLLSIGRKDVAALQAMIKAAPAIPGLAGQATAQAEAAARTAAGGTQTAALSSTEALAVARNMGISPDAWAKSVAAAAAAA